MKAQTVGKVKRGFVKLLKDGDITYNSPENIERGCSFNLQRCSSGEVYLIVMLFGKRGYTVVRHIEFDKNTIMLHYHNIASNDIKGMAFVQCDRAPVELIEFFTTNRPSEFKTTHTIKD